MLHAHPEPRRPRGGGSCPTPHPLPPVAPRAVPAARWAALAAVLLLGALLAGCGGAAPPGPDERERELIDYRARHQQMLDSVLERPGQLEAQRLERERQARARSQADWEAVMARQGAHAVERERRRRGGEEEYQRILARQRQYNEARNQARTDQWARFVEQNAPPAPEESGGTPAAGNP